MDKNPISIINQDEFILTHANRRHIAIVQSWFSTAQEAKLWAGPSFEFPVTGEVFFAQLDQHDYQSFALLYAKQVIGFAQYQQHPPLLHIGRIVINPSMRGRGLVSVLLQKLIAMGNADVNIQKVSLYVYSHHRSAYKAYVKYGFIKTKVTAGLKVATDCDYLSLVI